MANSYSPLGKGLSSLLSSTDPAVMTQLSDKNAFIPNVPIEDIAKNPYQPRKNAEDNVDDLVASIKEHGFFSPLIVSRLPDGKFQLIAGERRLSAAKKAGLTSLPVIVQEAAGGKLLELAIVENIQRKDLNPVEEAQAYRQLINEFHLTQKEAAKRIGISPELVSRRLSLLTLPEFALQALMENKITTPHAEALFPLIPDTDSLRVALEAAIRNQLSVKQLKSIVDKLAAGLSLRRTLKINDEKTREMEVNLTKLLGRKIYFSRTERGGKIVISFNDDKELDDIYGRLSYIGYHI